jgi:hypothetical protein
MKIEVEISFFHLKIKFNGLVHLHINRSDFLGYQSWIDGPKYCIEFTMKNNSVILCEYDTMEKFRTILEQLDERLSAQ